jgi:ATP-binding cassette subfamily F protein 3
VVLELEDVSKAYGDKRVLEEVNLLIERGSKIAFVGQNGQGKTTLARVLVGELPFEGHLRLGHNVQLGYFAQDQADLLNGAMTVEETMLEAATETTRPKVRDILGAFLFRGDEVDKPVKVLSGGERNRLALARMLLQPFNVLVMDEPTNHLDIPSKNVLKEALRHFEGTLILVSHDRDFLQGLTNLVYEFRDHRIKPYLGDINSYLEQRNAQNFREVEKGPDGSQSAEQKSTPKGRGAEDYKARKKRKSLQNKLSTLEKQIQALEKKIAEVDHELLMNYDETIAEPGFFESYQGLKDELEALMQQWEALSTELESHH